IDLRHGDALLVMVREVRVARSVVDGRDAQRREPRDIRPAVLRTRLGADGRHELPGDGRVESWAGAVRGVRDLDLEAVQHLADVRGRLCGRLAGRKTVVDLDLAQVGDHVPGDAPGDAHRTQALAVHQSLDGHLLGAVLRETGEDGSRPVDRVLPDPGPRAV